MIPKLKRFFYNLLFDEAASQRYVAGALFFLGTLLSRGGTIPGTALVIPGWSTSFLADWSETGELVKMLAVYIGAAGALPSTGAPVAVASAVASAVPSASPRPPAPAA